MSQAITTQFQSYGASELKSSYHKFLEWGLIIAIIAHSFVLSTYALINYLNKLSEEESKKQQQRVINVTLTDLEAPPSATEEEEALRIEEKFLPPVKDLTALTPEPVAREKAELQTIKTQKELEEIKTPVSKIGDTAVFSYTGPVKIEEKKIEEKILKEEKKIEEKTVYQSFEVEKPPECVNLSQVRSSMKYPDIAREAGIEGRVNVKVLVGTDGSVIKIGSISGPDVFYDEVRTKAVDLQFTPALQNGKPVKVWVTVPFNFKLQN